MPFSSYFCRKKPASYLGCSRLGGPVCCSCVIIILPFVVVSVLKAFILLLSSISALCFVDCFKYCSDMFDYRLQWNSIMG